MILLTGIDSCPLRKGDLICLTPEDKYYSIEEITNKTSIRIKRISFIRNIFRIMQGLYEKGKQSFIYHLAKMINELNKLLEQRLNK